MGRSRPYGVRLRLCLCWYAQLLDRTALPVPPLHVSCSLQQSDVECNKLNGGLPVRATKRARPLGMSIRHELDGAYFSRCRHLGMLW